MNNPSERIPCKVFARASDASVAAAPEIAELIRWKDEQSLHTLTSRGLGHVAGDAGSFGIDARDDGNAVAHLVAGDSDALDLFFQCQCVCFGRVTVDNNPLEAAHTGKVAQVVAIALGIDRAIRVQRHQCSRDHPDRIEARPHINLQEIDII